MCYTNPGLIRQVVQDARDYFDGKGAKPGAIAAGDFFAVVPMDNDTYCKCPTCAALIGRGRLATRGKGMFANDRASNYAFSFVNTVAEAIEKSHPHKHIATLAYSSYSYPPTALKLEPNVCITLCLQSRNIFSRSTQQNDQAVLDAWVAESKSRPKLLWLYYCYPSVIAANNNFRCFPGFFAHTIVNQMQMYRTAGILGVSYEPSYIGYNQYSPLLDQLEFYVTWKLADDPTLDGNALIDEFFDRYYGSAAAPMRIVYELIEQAYASNYVNCFGEYLLALEDVAWTNLGTKAGMAQLGWLMEQARSRQD